MVNGTNKKKEKTRKYRLRLTIELSDGRKSETETGWLAADQFAEMIAAIRDDILTEGTGFGWNAFKLAWKQAGGK